MLCTMESINASDEEIAPLLAGGSLSLQSRFLLNRTIGHKSSEASRVGRIARPIVKGVGIIVTNAGKMPFVSVALDYAKPNLVYGGFLAYGNLVSFIAINTSVLLRIVDEELRPLAAEEVQMLRQGGCCSIAQAVRFSACTAIGLVAQVSMSFIGYEYNDKSLALAALVFFGEAILPIYSIWSTVEAVHYRRSLHGHDSTLYRIRGRVISRLAANETALRSISIERRSAWLDDFRQLASGSFDIAHLHKTLRLLLHPIEASSSVSNVRLVTRGTFAVAGTAFTVGQIILNGRLGQLAIAEATHGTDDGDPWYTYAGGTVVVACLTKFLIDGIFFTALATHDRLADGVEGRYPLGLVARPVVFAILSVWALITAALAYGPTMQIADDSFDGDFATAEQVLCTGGVLLLALFGLTDVIDRIIESSARNIEHNQVGSMVRATQALGRLRLMYSRTSLQEFGKHFAEFPDDMRDSLTQGLNFSSEELGGSRELSVYVEEEDDSDSI